MASRKKFVMPSFIPEGWVDESKGDVYRHVLKSPDGRQTLSATRKDGERFWTVCFVNEDRTAHYGGPACMSIQMFHEKGFDDLDMIHAAAYCKMQAYIRRQQNSGRSLTEYADAMAGSFEVFGPDV